MRQLTFIVPPECDGSTVGRFLRGRCAVSARMVTKLKQVSDGIQLNGEHIRTIDNVSVGDTITLNIPNDVRPAQPVALSISVVYEDDDVIILDKPANMPVHPTHGHNDDTLANAYAHHLGQKGEAAAFRPLNRLDKDTTGLVVVCKHAHSAAVLTGHVEKIYYAICEGILTGSGVIDAPIRRREGAGIRREIGEGGQRAVTHWQAVCSVNGMTLLSIRLETGRTHQIRTHFADYMHMPLVGDDMYGGSRERMGRQALHCGEAAFEHPITGERMRFSSELPEDMRALLSPTEA